MFKLFVITVSFLMSAGFTFADLLRTGTDRWAVIASTQDIENAIAIGEIYTPRFSEVHVVMSSTGWFAVVGGPVPIPKGIKTAREQLRALGGFPDDMFMSNGQNFIRSAWSNNEPPVTQTWKYDGKQPLSIKASGLNITVSTETKGDEHFPAITLKQGDRILTKTALKDSGFYDRPANAQVDIVWLDRTSSRPQILFSSFSGGAHCCTQTSILTEYAGEWHAIDAPTLDGDGYTLRDIDGNGEAELIGTDNSFLYRFSSYAESWAPLSITRLNGTNLVNMRSNPAFQKYYRRAIYRAEFIAKMEPDLWHTNGFLAGWTALKTIVNESGQAWETTIARYDRTSDWPFEVCDAAVSNSPCPEEARRKVSFPEALKYHLARAGYTDTQPPPQVASATPASTPTNPPKQEPVPTASSGTGFFISEKGDIVTNHHVVKGCTSINIKRQNATPEKATLIAEDPTNDLALLHTETGTGSHAALRVDTRLGEAVAAFGYPLSSVLASSGNFTLGNVTALAGLKNDTRFIQISAPVQPGNSGGPLLDSYGNVIGVVTSKLDAITALAAVGDIPQNVNFALRGSSLYAFLLTYGITPTIAVTTTQLEAPDLADRAASFSVAVTCH